MYNYDQDEREYEIKKRERWLKNSRRKEKIVETIGDFFHGVGNITKRITHKKTPEEIELEKRELWLIRSRRKEQLKAKIANIFTKKEKEINEEDIETGPIKDYDLSNFQSLLDDFNAKKEKDEQLEIIQENLKIREEAKQEEEKETKKVRINIDSFKEVLNNGKEFIINKVTPKDKATRIRNLKIAKVTLGSLLAASSTIVLAKHNLPMNVIDALLIATPLNVGMYTAVHGLVAKEKEEVKVKVFKDLSNIGE